MRSNRRCYLMRSDHIGSGIDPVAVMLMFMIIIGIALTIYYAHC